MGSVNPSYLTRAIIKHKCTYFYWSNFACVRRLCVWLYNWLPNPANSAVALLSPLKMFTYKFPRFSWAQSCGELASIWSLKRWWLVAMLVYIDVYMNSIPSSLCLSCFQYVVTLFCGQMVPSQFVTLNSHIVPRYSQNFSWVFKPWAKTRVLLMCTLRSFSHKPKKTCFTLSFTLKLWYKMIWP